LNRLLRNEKSAPCGLDTLANSLQVFCSFIRSGTDLISLHILLFLFVVFVVLLVVWATLSKNPKAPSSENRIRIKFSRIVFQVNTHRLNLICSDLM